MVREYKKLWKRIVLSVFFVLLMLPLTAKAQTNAEYFKKYNSFQEFFSTEKCEPWTWDQLMTLKNRSSSSLTMGEKYYLYIYDVNRTGYMTKVKMQYQYIKPDGTQGNAFTLGELDNGTQFNMLGLENVLSFVNPGEYVIITSLTFADGSSWNGIAFSLYTVTYDANGGSGAPTGQLKRYGKALEITKNTPTREGYTFLGWSTDPNAQTASYKGGSSYTAEKVLKLYAVWKRNTYTISFGANGGSGAPASQTKSYGDTTWLSTAVPTRTGYDFLGWSDGKTDTSPKWNSGNSFSENKNIKLYAVWREKQYQISYNSNGGSGTPAAQTKTYTQSLILSTNVPDRSGYLFQGWAENSTADAAEYMPGEVFTKNENITLYAVWKQASVPDHSNNGNTQTPDQGNNGTPQNPNQDNSSGISQTTNQGSNAGNIQTPNQNNHAGNAQTPSQGTNGTSQISELQKYAPKKMSLSVKSKKKRTLTIKWKRNKKVSGYELQYSTSAKFPASKRKTRNGFTSSNKTTSSTVRRLKSKKTYYVRIRAYKKVKGIRVSGAWSAVKKVKVK